MPILFQPEPPEPHDGPLIGADSDWWNTACINPFGTSWTTYARGYLAAARILVEKVGETKSEQDSLVYPIVFLCRQYLELTLKYLLSTAREFLGEDAQTANGHSLIVPWNTLRPLFERLDKRMNQRVLSRAELEEVHRLLRECEKVDRTSFAFRYPVDKKGVSSHPQDLAHLIVRRLIDGVNRLAHLLDSLVVATDYYHDFWGPGAEP